MARKPTIRPDAAVRHAAAALKTAITAAKGAGYVVTTAFRPEDLDRIAVSQTAKVKD